MKLRCRHIILFRFRYWDVGLGEVDKFNFWLAYELLHMNNIFHSPISFDNESYLCRKTTSTSTSSRSSCKKSLRKWDTDSYVMCPQTTICLCIFEIQLCAVTRVGVQRRERARWMLIEGNLIFHSSSSDETGAPAVDESRSNTMIDWWRIKIVENVDSCGRRKSKKKFNVRFRSTDISTSEINLGINYLSQCTTGEEFFFHFLK